MAQDLKLKTPSVQHGGDAVMAWAFMASNGSGLPVFSNAFHQVHRGYTACSESTTHSKIIGPR